MLSGVQHEVSEQRRFTECEIEALLRDNWSVVVRVAKRIERYGTLTPHLLLSGIAHELCLMQRDMAVLGGVLTRCVEDQVVSMQRLRDTVAAAGVSHRFQSPRRPPPFALAADRSDSVGKSLPVREEQFRANVLKAAGGKNTVPRKALPAIVSAVDRFGVSDREAADLFSVLDPKRTGFVNVEDFCDRFAVEFLKPKSMRPTLGVTGSDGKATAFEWSCPEAVTPRSARLHRPKTTGSPRSVKTTRSSTLRRAITETSLSSETRQRPLSAVRLPPAPPQRAQRINLTVVASPRMLGNVPPS